MSCLVNLTLKLQINMTKIEPKIDRILAVDDSPDNLFLVQAILEDEGYIIDLADDGFAALEQIERNPPRFDSFGCDDAESRWL